MVLRHFVIESFFETEISSYINKSMQHQEYLRQLALVTIYNIPGNALRIYTDGSREDGAFSGSVLLSNVDLALGFVEKMQTTSLFS